ncbi:MAG TPA: alpha/beta hydrolase family protein [Candidatus Binatia bacterium]|nr:alpha/beta hydrolase family protein [Candidatus Binatia bacterium]
MSAERTYVLVHGAWHGGWYWRRVSDLLGSAGHRVFAPSLTGLGDRRHLLSRDINLHTHIEDIIQLIEAEELHDVILVGHSYGGIVITGVAAKIPQGLKQLVYLDAVLVEDGESWSSVHSAEIVAARRKAAQESSGGVSLPPPKALDLGVIDIGDQAWVDRRMTPHPFVTYEQKMRWGGPIGNGLPKVYIDCTEPASPALAPMKTRYRGKADWPFIEIKTGHDAAVTAPKELTDILLRF